MTTAQATLFARLPEAFQIHEAFSKSNTPVTEIRDLSGRKLFSLTTGEPRAIGSLIRSGKLVFIERISSAMLRGGDNTSVWMRDVS